ncbi:RND family efflux transporter, MFP subunit [Fodinibius salinus]|uniref:RND family efflux transporter, MFP subunit n=1 Tax=Fodinibius salinus TaxID=860790 RepID=A0A5D3YIF9_9BACT|nr:efflux RND transporter periplasmic adaptor subunit [Fodinibius salinus]TYP92020.1 RND family efflux transporter, MFP subunit [Fodinibius salinus]
MNRRKLSVLAGALIFIISIPLAWYLSGSAPEQADREPPVDVIKVPTITANPGTLTNRIQFTGRVIPEGRFDIFAEVTGRLMPEGKPFKTGTTFEKGEAIITLNDDEQRQQLKASKYEFSALISRILPDINIDYPNAYDDWQQYLENFDASDAIPPLPEVNNRQLQLYLNSQNIYSRYASIRQQEVRVDKFTIEAPFDGVVTENTVDPGALVQPSQRLGEFTKIDPLEIEASIPAEQAQFIKVGDRVELQFRTAGRKDVEARIDRKNAVIDPSSQSVKVFMKINDSNLKAGAYVEGSIAGRPFDNAVRIHQDALVRDNNIFVIRDSTAHFTEINVLAQSGDSVTISGLKPSTVIIDDFREASFEGSTVAPLGDQ